MKAHRLLKHLLSRNSSRRSAPSALACAALVAAASAAAGADLYVNNQTGDDANPGTESRPLATARRAIKNARPGDVIHLHPPGAIYRETLTFNNKTNIVIEGNGCTLSGADPLSADPGQWEAVGPDLHRRQIGRTSEDRYILAVDGVGSRMGRNKYSRGDLAAQFPPLDQLQPGEFRVEPVDGQSAWLYVKGTLTNLEWAVRDQDLETDGHTHDITVRNLNARHALNDGFGLHGDSQNIVLLTVRGYENYDNGVSPHGGCSIVVEDGNFRDNGTPDWAQGDATETVYRRCQASGSGHQWEVVFAGGFHLVEDSTVHLDSNELWFVYWAPRGGAIEEILLAGKDPTVKPEFWVRDTAVLGDPVRKGIVKIGAEATLTLVDCTFSNVIFDVDAGVVVRVSGGTADGRPLHEVIPGAVTINVEPPPPQIDSVASTGGGLRFEFVGSAGVAYAVERCDRLGSSPWVTIANYPAQPVARRFLVNDATATALAQRFYRIVVPPRA